MSEQQHYSLVVIGGGPAGYTAAVRAAQNGMDAAIIERGEIGGTCLNRGCMPTKSLLHSGRRYADAKEGGAVTFDGLGYDIGKIYDERDGVVAKLKAGVEKLLAARKITVIKGSAAFISPTQVAVDGKVITADNFLIATGGRACGLDIEGAELAVNSDYILSGRADLPDDIIIIGGGVIGVEFASFFADLGKRVQILEYAERLLPSFDRDVSLQLALSFRKRGVKTTLSAAVKGIHKNDGGYSVLFAEKGVDKRAECSLVIMCAGRRADISGLSPEKAGVAIERGAVKTDANFKTTAENIYAAGDCRGGIQLAHYAMAQGEFIADSLAGVKNRVNLSVIPACVYTYPEIAAVGLTEADCLARGIQIQTGKFPMGANGKSVISGAGGFVKTVFEKDSGKLLGATLLCERATEIIGELALALACGLGKEDIASVIHAHPTVSEAVAESALATSGRAIHIL